MNHIDATLGTLTWRNSRSGLNYYQLAVDGILLESLALDLNPGAFQPGLVPTLLNWLRDPDQRQLVWSRILPQDESSVICPVLMCADDIDLYCITVIAEISVTQQHVHWTRLGAGHSVTDFPDFRLDDIPWLTNWIPRRFCRSNYEDVLSDFRLYLDDDSRDVYPLRDDETLHFKPLVLGDG